jgi:hypothetical protein
MLDRMNAGMEKVLRGYAEMIHLQFLTKPRMIRLDEFR